MEVVILCGGKGSRLAEETILNRQITPYFKNDSKRPSIQIKEIENVNFKDLDNFLFDE